MALLEQILQGNSAGDVVLDIFVAVVEHRDDSGIENSQMISDGKVTWHKGHR